MCKRALVGIIIILLTILISSCSKEQGPSKADLESSLAAQLPKFTQISDFTIEASDNVGDKVDPLYKTRFRAKLQVTEDTFTEDGRYSDALLLAPVKKKGDTIDIFGKSESRLRSGKWETTTTIEDSPFANLGEPLSDFSAPKILINGTEEEKAYRAELERVAEAIRQAEMAKQDILKKALRSGKPFEGQAYCDYTVKVTLTVDSFDETSGEFTAQFQGEGRAPFPVTGRLSGTSVNFEDNATVLPCDFSTSFDEGMMILTGSMYCGPMITCPVDLSLPRE